MGLRTYVNGIIRAGDIGNIFRPRSIKNPYTTYRYLWSQTGDRQEVIENLKQRVDKGYISLEELLSGGRAARLFLQIGIYNECVSKLAQMMAQDLSINPEKLKRFLKSGGRGIPYVVEQVPADRVASALSNLSVEVKQRSVVDLTETSKSAAMQDFDSHVIRMTYQIKYDEKQISTLHFPGDIQGIFCFDRQPTRVFGINRGLLITDRFVSNASAILDHLSEQKFSPLDHILIYLRGLQGLTYPTSLSMALSWPKVEREEFISRDHFTERARNIIHRLVSGEFDNMMKRGGDPLSFRLYVSRNADCYHAEISWNLSWKKN